jgi:hypothetical protein
VPLTGFQAGLARLLAVNRSPDSYLAGGAAIYIEPNTTRYSNDLDYFQDSAERVAKAHEQDKRLLLDGGYQITVDLQQPGFVRARVRKDGEATKIEWSHDSAWRFLPTLRHQEYGYQLHPIDLAINKVLALVGRNEARDFIDTLHVCEKVLSLGALGWAAAGKDPGFTPLSLLELLRRRGKYQPEDFDRLMLTETVVLPAMKLKWVAALDSAETFIRSRPAEEIGCLYYSTGEKRFVEPGKNAPDDVVPHYGRPGGVLPSVHLEA